ncbi:hypothetical protein ACFL28_05585, partial [Candidatus Omnitrophota bacterium]
MSNVSSKATGEAPEERQDRRDLDPTVNSEADFWRESIASVEWQLQEIGKVKEHGIFILDRFLIEDVIDGRDGAVHFRALELVEGSVDGRVYKGVSQKEDITDIEQLRIDRIRDGEEIVIDDIPLSIDPDIFDLEVTSEDEFHKIIEAIFAGLTQEQKENLRAKQRLRGSLLFALLDTSTYLFEDHIDNSFIGINKAILKIEDPTIRNIILQVGLAHELRHEARDVGEEKEAEFLPLDLALLRGLLDQANVDYRRLISSLTQIIRLDSAVIWHIVNLNELVYEEELLRKDLEFYREKIRELIRELILERAPLPQEGPVEEEGMEEGIEEGMEEGIEARFERRVEEGIEEQLEEARGRDIRQRVIPARRAGFEVYAEEESPEKIRITFTEIGRGDEGVTFSEVYEVDRFPMKVVARPVSAYIEYDRRSKLLCITPLDRYKRQERVLINLAEESEALEDRFVATEDSPEKDILDEMLSLRVDHYTIDSNYYSASITHSSSGEQYLSTSHDGANVAIFSTARTVFSNILTHLRAGLDYPDDNLLLILDPGWIFVQDGVVYAKRAVVLEGREGSHFKLKLLQFENPQAIHYGLIKTSMQTYNDILFDTDDIFVPVSTIKLWEFLTRQKVKTDIFLRKAGVM